MTSHRKAAEASFAISVALALLLFAHELRAIWGSVLSSAFWGAISFLRLLADDFRGTLLTGFGAWLKVAVLLAPAVRFWLDVEQRHRLAWLPLFALGYLLLLPLSFPAIASFWTWSLLVVACAGAFWLAGHRLRPLRFAAFAPVLLLLEPTLSHSPLGDTVWSTERLAERCADNAGEHPHGYDPSMARTRHYAVTQLDSDTLLLSGERGSSHWVTRRPSGQWAFDRPSALAGNFWEGCAMNGSLWFTNKGRIVRVTRDPDGTETIETYELPVDVAGTELDFVDPICDPAANAIYASELVRGGLRVLHLDDGRLERRELGGFNLQLLRRDDGMFVGIDTAHVFEYDPRRDEIVSSAAAGVAAMGFDLCPVDGSVAVADMAGRLRIFERTDDGYAFARGVLLEAPRRVAFSPDCAVIAVTSADDHTVYTMDSDLEYVSDHAFGPGLRDITFLDDGQLAVADACTITLL